MRPRHTPAAVLFDLDDTLFDHEQSAREALRHVHHSQPGFARWPFADFERAHSGVLEELHLEVLAGTRTIDAAREERFRRLFIESGVAADSAVVRATAQSYREAYMAARRPIEGALELLAALKPRVRIGIVSNNIVDEQEGKLALFGFRPYVDGMAISEAVGVAKPDPAIFAYALRELQCEAADAVMVGDSWIADIAGALAAGIRPVWFNRSARRAPAGAPRVREIASLLPTHATVTAILSDDTESDSEADLRCASA